jgi:hypothetical protein
LLTCKQFLAELSDFLDESLGVAERQKLEEHINACPNCWVIADTTRKTIQVYKCHEPITIPSEIRSRLMKALEKKMSANRGSTV